MSAGGTQQNGCVGCNTRSAEREGGRFKPRCTVPRRCGGPVLPASRRPLCLAQLTALQYHRSRLESLHHFAARRTGQGGLYTIKPSSQQRRRGRRRRHRLRRRCCRGPAARRRAAAALPDDGLEESKVLLRVYPLHQRHVEAVALALD